MSSQAGVVIDASLRFARSDPALLSYARDSAERVGVPVDDLLRDAIARVAAIRAAQLPAELRRARRPANAARDLSAVPSAPAGVVEDVQRVGEAREIVADLIRRLWWLR